VNDERKQMNNTNLAQHFAPFAKEIFVEFLLLGVRSTEFLRVPNRALLLQRSSRKQNTHTQHQSEPSENAVSTKEQVKWMIDSSRNEISFRIREYM
jgi:hypothetical protein